MADFYQNGVVTTLHNITRRSADELDYELNSFARFRRLGLVLPSLYSELQAPALEKIVQELQPVRYLKRIVIGLDRANESEFHHAKRYFDRLPQDHVILWNDGPRLMEIHNALANEGLAPTELGKGRNVWYCFGYVLAKADLDGVALHDCDIVTYTRELLARLIYPIAHPQFNYAYAKGYYTRVGSDRNMNGRAARLFVTPLIRALKRVCGPSEYLDYLDTFRYPLCGEMALRTGTLADLRIPSDWGLEIGILSEMNRNYSTNRICQVDIADIYDHKHQKLSANDSSTGLSRMTLDIALALFRKLATEGSVFSNETFRTVKATYLRIALDLIETYANDARMNGLSIDRHKEERAVEVFSENILAAGSRFLDAPMEAAYIPSWRRVVSAMPDIFEWIVEAVEADNKNEV
ncbi:MAG: glycosyl transferase [Pseudomonadota bacterium]